MNLELSIPAAQTIFAPKIYQVLELRQNQRMEGARYISKKRGTLLFLLLEGRGSIAVKRDVLPVCAPCFCLLEAKNFLSFSPEEGAALLRAVRFSSDHTPPELEKQRIYTPAKWPESLLFEAARQPDAPVSLLQSAFVWDYFQLVTCAGAPQVTPYHEQMQQAASLLQNPGENPQSLSQLAKQLHLSERNFRKMFKLEYGMSAKKYMQKARMERAKSLLQNPALTIREVAEQLGYYSQFQFSHDFKNYFGQTPSVFRKHG